MCSDIHLLLCACVVRSCPDVPDVHLYQLRVRTLKPEPAVQWLSFVLLTYIGHLECQWAHLRRIRTDGMFYRLVAIFWEKKNQKKQVVFINSFLFYQKTLFLIFRAIADGIHLPSGLNPVRIHGAHDPSLSTLLVLIKTCQGKNSTHT